MVSCEAVLSNIALACCNEVASPNAALICALKQAPQVGAPLVLQVHLLGLNSVGATHQIKAE
jgi:hypothetical protein